MVEQIVYYMMRFRKQLFVLAVIIVLTMLSLIKVPEIDNRLTGYNVDNNPYDSVGLRMAELFGSKDPVQVKVSPEPTTTLVVFEALELMESELIRAFPGIRIESLHKASSLLFRTVNSDSSVFEMMKVAGKIPVICNLVSRDSLSFLMVAYTDHVTSFDPDVFDRIIHEPYKGIISASAISLSHIQLQTEKSIRRDYTLILPLILLFVMIFIFYSYRSLGAIMFSAINILFSGISVFFFFTVMKVNINQVTATSIAVVVVLSLSVSVHFLTGFFFHEAKLPVANRILMMLRFYLVPVFLTSITTAIAFGSFFLSDSLYVKQFGLVSAASLLTTSILTCFAAPLMLGFIKSRSQKPFLSLTVTRFQAVILRNNRVISIVLILVLGISFFFISKVTFRTNLETFIPLKTPVYKSYQEIR
ncbi:MAG: hypothetical protein E4G92_02280 [Bacteroidia bacterium]|nr:MAG: hypothetical protein E4G92_02280 [Bacteroidia bacterium]